MPVEVDVLADVGKVASDSKAILWDALGGLENSLELFFDVERVFGENIPDGVVDSSSED